MLIFSSRGAAPHPAGLPPWTQDSPHHLVHLQNGWTPLTRVLAGEAHRACVAHVMYKVDWARGEVSPHSGFTVKTSPEAAATPSEARGAPHLRSLIVIRRDFPIFRQEAQIGE
jgi:hypothetical protein